ncbi:MAG: FAD-dependent oxidoreductase [Syntrophothermaceae bacterium]
MSGKADLIGMARGLLADPDLPQKVMEGRFDEIRKCIGCNQGCLDQIFRGKSCHCLVNVQAGREDDTRIRPVENRKKVLIIGGGPAGMEAARVAALRGHRVSLWEKSGTLGGQLRLAAAVPGRKWVHRPDQIPGKQFTAIRGRYTTANRSHPGAGKRFCPTVHHSRQWSRTGCTCYYRDRTQPRS